MNNQIIKFLTDCNTKLPIQEPIYEFGSRNVQKSLFPPTRSLFPNKEYVGCDFIEGEGVDEIMDVHNLHLPDNSVGTIICSSVLEHVENPIKAIEEFKRVLKSNGIIIITVPFIFPVHSYPNDYWRFTPECMRTLFKDFRYVDVQYSGGEVMPDMISCIASNKYFFPPIFPQHHWSKKYVDLLVPKFMVLISNFLRRKCPIKF
jgi:SAM-dependent methyltransferase